MSPRVSQVLSQSAHWVMGVVSLWSGLCGALWRDEALCDAAACNQSPVANVNGRSAHLPPFGVVAAVHSRVATRQKLALPSMSTRHTTPVTSPRLRPRWPPARLPEGLGQLCFPLCQPRVPRGTRLSRFRRNVHQSRCFTGPAAPVRTAAVPERFFYATVLAGTACATVAPACRTRAACPCHDVADVHPSWLGTPAAGKAPSAFRLPKLACAGTAAVRTA